MSSDTAVPMGLIPALIVWMLRPAPPVLPAHDLLGELDEMPSLAQRSLELCRTYVNEAVVGGVLDLDQLAQLAGRSFAAGSDLFEQQLGIVMVVGTGTFPELLAAGGIGSCDPSKDCDGGGHTSILK